MWIPRRPFLTKNLTHEIRYYLTYLMIIWWLFDDYLHYCNYSLHWNVTLLRSRCKKVNVNDSVVSPVCAFARLYCLKIPVARPARLICMIPLCKASPVHFDVGGEHCTIARMWTRRYNVCIWNSRIVLYACFVFDLFDGASATPANAMHQIEQAGSRSPRLL